MLYVDFNIKIRAPQGSRALSLTFFIALIFSLVIPTISITPDVVCTCVPSVGYMAKSTARRHCKMTIDDAATNTLYAKKIKAI